MLSNHFYFKNIFAVSFILSILMISIPMNGDTAININNTNSVSTLNNFNGKISSTSSDKILLTGELQMMDAGHKGEGTVLVVNDSSNLILVFESNVKINSGPDLYIYLSKIESFNTISDDPGENIDLGSLPSLTGPFNVSIPNSIDISEYKSIIIWCLPFTVIFSYASLTPYSASQSTVTAESTQPSSQTAGESTSDVTSISSEITSDLDSSSVSTTNGFFLITFLIGMFWMHRKNKK